MNLKPSFNDNPGFPLNLTVVHHTVEPIPKYHNGTKSMPECFTRQVLKHVLKLQLPGIFRLLTCLLLTPSLPPRLFVL